MSPRSIFSRAPLAVPMAVLMIVLMVSGIERGTKVVSTKVSMPGRTFLTRLGTSLQGSPVSPCSVDGGGPTACASNPPMLNWARISPRYSNSLTVSCDSSRCRARAK
ncbi:MAG: hypothetical protein JOS17DRAFT_749634 [Linnemannia elongata]|nr:MAG: hypothetical protein JOS17DRAFT_749634 [Linnemannia elongata]